MKLEEAKKNLKNKEPETIVMGNLPAPRSSSDTKRAGTDRENAIKKAQADRDDIAERLSHLQCYQDFVRSDISGYLELREQSANGTLTTVTFEDLWFVFRPGDVIFANKDGFEQMSQVFHVTGGQLVRRRTGLAEYDSLRREVAMRHRHQYDHDASDEEDGLQDAVLTYGSWTSFIIDSFVMGQDGTKIGPVQERQVISHFEGEKNILDLDVFPIRFHNQRDVLLEKMAQRGGKLLHSKGHKGYRGPAREMSTPSGTGTSVRSDVFIDLTTYYRTNSSLKPSLGPGHLSKSYMLSVEEEEEIYGEEDYRILHGSGVDTKAAEDFFASNIHFLRPISTSEVETSTEHLRLLPHNVIGYAFQTKAWCK